MSNVSRRTKAPPPLSGWINRTYRLAGETVESIDSLAGELGVNQSDLVSYLLEMALVQVETGRLTVPIVTREVHSVKHNY